MSGRGTLLPPARKLVPRKATCERGGSSTWVGEGHQQRDLGAGLPTGSQHISTCPLPACRQTAKAPTLWGSRQPSQMRWAPLIRREKPTSQMSSVGWEQSFPMDKTTRKQPIASFPLPHPRALPWPIHHEMSSGKSPLPSSSVLSGNLKNELVHKGL